MAGMKLTETEGLVHFDRLEYEKREGLAKEEDGGQQDSLDSSISDRIYRLFEREEEYLTTLTSCRCG